MPRLRFRTDPKDDLSVRTDFTYSLMEKISKRLREIADKDPEVAKIREKAKVEIFARGSLMNVSVDVWIQSNPESKITDEEKEAAKKSVQAKMEEAMTEVFPQSLQEAMTETRQKAGINVR